MNLPSGISIDGKMAEKKIQVWKLVCVWKHFDLSGFSLREKLEIILIPFPNIFDIFLSPEIFFFIFGYI